MKVHKVKGVLFLLLALVLMATALGPAPALATPAGPSGTLYVATAGNQSVVAIDLASGSVENEISVAANIPHGLAITPGGQRLYVSYMGGTTIKVIDTATGQVVDTITVGVPSHHIQVNRQGTELYIAPGAGNLFYIYDLREGSLLPPLVVGTGATDVAVSPDGRTALVASTGFVPTSVPASVSVVDLLNKEVLAIVSLPAAIGLTPAADHVIFSPNGKLGYVVDRGANRLAVLDLSTLTWVGSVIVGTAPHGIVVTNDGKYIYMGNRGLSPSFGNTLSVIDAETYTVVETITITVGTRPDHLTLDRSGRFIFIPITRPVGSQKMLILEVATNTIVDEIAVGKDLHVSVQGR